MVILESGESLKGWKYPIYTDLYDKPVVDALMKAGLSRELLRSADPNKMQLFDFVASPKFSKANHPFQNDRVVIEIIMKIEQEEGGIGMEHAEVVSIPFTYPSN